MIMKIMPVPVAIWIIAVRKAGQVKVRLKMAMRPVPSAPTAAASVGVKTPV